MAPKPPTLKEKKDPPVSTDSIEEDDDDDDEVSSSSEEEPEKTAKPSSSRPPPKQSTTTTTTSTPQPQSSESESEESDSEESEPEKTHRPTSAPDPNVKPIASKPMEETTKTTKPRSKIAATPSKSSPKRARENDSHRKDPKKAKMGSGHDPEQLSVADPKKLLFQRLWSENDEIAVLKGMVEYSRKKGADPMTDMNQFLEYIKNSLHFDVTKPQLHDKIRRLKKKYENNLGRGKKGNEPTFSKPHEQKAYEISKKVWGSEAAELSAAPLVKSKTRANSKASAPEGKNLKIDEINNVGFEGMDEYVIKHGLEFVDGSKKVELEEGWRKFQLAQLELFVERSKLVFDQAKLMLEAMKSSNQ